MKPVKWRSLNGHVLLWWLLLHTITICSWFSQWLMIVSVVVRLWAAVDSHRFCCTFYPSGYVSIDMSISDTYSMLHVWFIYLQNCVIFGANSSTMVRIWETLYSFNVFYCNPVTPIWLFKLQCHIRPIRWWFLTPMVLKMAYYWVYQIAVVIILAIFCWNTIWFWGSILFGEVMNMMCMSTYA